MKNVESDLKRLKEDISSAETEKAELKGQLKGLMNQLSNDFDCGSLKEATKLLKDTEGRRIKLKKEIGGDYEELRETYEW